MRNTLVLPVGGNATRMLGLPKFLLPASEHETLIEKHCRGALGAGYDEVVVITRPVYTEILVGIFENLGLRINVITLGQPTLTMNETLLNGLSTIHNGEEFSLTIGLADSAFVGEDYSVTYTNLLKSTAMAALGLFAIRADQFGKLGQVLFNESNMALDIKDKNSECKYPFIWGLAKIPSSYLKSVDMNDQHIGISLEKWIKAGVEVGVSLSSSEYFDCGTFSEYRKFLQ
jgi:hypothetical protein